MPNNLPTAWFKAYNQSGLELFGKLAVQPGNLVISPFSIGVAYDHGARRRAR